MGTCKQSAAPILRRRQAGQIVVATAVEETLKEEVVFESLGILSHVACCNVDIAQGLIDVLSCCNSIRVRSQSLCQALMDLLKRRIGLRGSRMNLGHCV